MESRTEDASEGEKQHSHAMMALEVGRWVMGRKRSDYDYYRSVRRAQVCTRARGDG